MSLGRLALLALLVVAGAIGLDILVVAFSLPLAVPILAIAAFAAFEIIRSAAAAPTRTCPRCGRKVKTGWVACGPCGYQFAPQVQARPQAPYWPPSPVTLQPPAAQPAPDDQPPTSEPAPEDEPPAAPVDPGALYRQRWPMRLPPLPQAPDDQPPASSPPAP